MNRNLDKIAIAALLHDVGKFWSRTRQTPPFDQQEKEHFNTYSHALWSAHFVEEWIGDPEIASWVRQHHSADTYESKLISLADWLASGERREDEVQQRGGSEEAALVSILSRVAREENASAFLPLAEHGDFSRFMPDKATKAGVEEYSSLWARFESILKQLDTRNARPGTWLSLTRRFTSRIPSATPTKYRGYIPDISLYEHSRATAAIAVCLAADNRTEEEIDTLRTAMRNPLAGRQQLTKPLCRLVCGNLSGIQEFLYAVPRKGASKSIKGRSFALQLVAEAAVEHLCGRLGLPSVCCVYNGGGRFYLLVPVGGEVNAAACQLEEAVFRHFDGALSLHLGETEVTASDFLGDDSGESAWRAGFVRRWMEAGEDANRKKAQKYSNLAGAGYADVFGDTVQEPHQMASWESSADQTGLSAEDGWYRDLGQALRDARWLVRTMPTAEPGGLNRFFSSLGWEYHLVSERGALPQGVKILEVAELNGYQPVDAVRRFQMSGAETFTYRFTAQAWPRLESGPVLTFEELAGNAEGARKLGVFRADVDNLGALFQNGLGANATFGRVAMLSSSLSDFFEGYVNFLIEDDPAFCDTVGVVYAGGDDLFVVGAWNHVFDFALRLREDFGRYAGGNPAVSLSGGVVVCEDHLPLRMAAEMALVAEEDAKAHERPFNGNVKAKDSLCILGHPVGFEEMPRFLELKDLLVGMLGGGEKRDPMPMGFLRRLYDVWEAYLLELRLVEKRRAGAPIEAIRAEARWQRWRWMMVYGLREFAKKNGEWTEEIKEVQERLVDDRLPVEDRLGVPLRWTELLLKKEELS